MISEVLVYYNGGKFPSLVFTLFHWATGSLARYCRNSIGLFVRPA